MKRLALAALAVLALAAPAQAATYTFNSTAGQELIITDARVRYNNSLPAAVCDNATPPVCVANPALKPTNVGFIGMVLLNAMSAWDALAGRPFASVAEKNAAIAMLQAAVARADANSPAAQGLLDKINASQ